MWAVEGNSTLKREVSSLASFSHHIMLDVFSNAQQMQNSVIVVAGVASPPAVADGDLFVRLFCRPQHVRGIHKGIQAIATTEGGETSAFCYISAFSRRKTSADSAVRCSETCTFSKTCIFSAIKVVFHLKTFRILGEIN